MIRKPHECYKTPEGRQDLYSEGSINTFFQWETTETSGCFEPSKSYPVTVVIQQIHNTKILQFLNIKDIKVPGKGDNPARNYRFPVEKSFYQKRSDVRYKISNSFIRAGSSFRIHKD